MSDAAPKPTAATPPAEEKPKSPPRDKKPSGRPPGRANAASVGKIEEGLTDLFSGFALAAQFQGNDVAYVILTSRGPKVASAWAELARQNASVRRVLERLMTGGAWGGVVVSTLSMALPLAQSYGAHVPNPFALTAEEVAQAMELRTMRDQVASAFAQSNGNGNGNGDGPSE